MGEMWLSVINFMLILAYRLQKNTRILIVTTALFVVLCNYFRDKYDLRKNYRPC